MGKSRKRLGRRSRSYVVSVELGEKKVRWARDHMPVLNELRCGELEKQPLKGLKVGISLHFEAKSAVLALTLRELGAEIAATSSNPLTADDDVVDYLKSLGVPIYAWKGMSEEEYVESLHRVLDIGPDIIVDDGADLLYLAHTERKEVLDRLIGGSEETTTGVRRLRNMEKKGVLRVPVFAVNDSKLKFIFDNKYGTGQSTIDGILSATNLLVAGKKAVVAGYGWVGRGVAMRLRGMGAIVTVTEVDPVKAVEALLDGFRVAPMIEAIRDADLVVTCTGDKDVVRDEHMVLAKDGVMLANAGHFNVEIDVAALERMAVEKREARPWVTEYRLGNGKRIYLLGEGRLINLVSGQGHPAEIMDISFSLQLSAVLLLARRGRELEPGVYNIPGDVEEEIAKLILRCWGVEIDSLTEEQIRYLSEEF